MATQLVGMADAFKRVYSGRAIMDLSMADRVLWGMIPKSTDFQGATHDFYIDYGKPQGRSKKFADAQANTTNSSGKICRLQRVRDYGFLHIDRESAEAAESDMGAFFKMKSHEQKMMLDNLSDGIWEGLYGTPSATKGTVGSYANPVITLSNKYDINKFDVGMELSIMSATKTERGTKTIDAINRDAGTITLSSDLSGTTAGDTLVQEGDRDADSDTRGISGLPSWIPPTAILAATTIFEMDRTADITRLGGIRFDGTGMLMVEAIIKALHTGRQHRARGIKKGFVNPLQYAQLCLELEGKTEYSKDTAQGEGGKQYAHISYEGIYVATPYGKVAIYADEMCPVDRLYLLNMDTWDFKSIKGAPRMLVSHVRDTADEMEIRNGWNGNLRCIAPGWNINVELTAPA